MMTMSGTSAAAPHVAGVAALYLAHRPTARPEEVAWALANAATPAVAEDGTGSTDLLLYSAFTGDTVDQPPFPTFTVSCSSGRRCTFNAADSADDGGIVNYSWDFGDGTSDEGRKRSRENHRYPHDGLVFEVTLIVTDTAGQSSTLVREVALPR
jgi:hypothetical protein